MKSRLFVLSFLMLLMSCSASTTSSNLETPPLPSNSTTPNLAEQSPSKSQIASNQNSFSVSPTQSISAKRIGLAQLGMTFGQLKQLLGSTAEFKVESPFMVDFDAIAVSKFGKVQYYILYPTGTTFTDANSIDLLLTENHNFKTVEGVGPGMSLKQAEAVYGEAILSYNTQNESREQVRFANQPAENLVFQPTAPNQDFAGIYPSPFGEYNQTKKFQEAASIRSVLVQ